MSSEARRGLPPQKRKSHAYALCEGTHDRTSTASRRRRRDVGAPTRGTASPGEGRDAGTRRHRGRAPPPADGRDARLHPAGRGRPRTAGGRLRGQAATDRLPPHVVRGPGVAVPGLHRLHLAVHPPGVPGQLRRPVRRRHPGPDRGSPRLQGAGRQQDAVVLDRGQPLRDRRRRPARRRIRGQRLPARRRHRLPHLAHQRPRHRTTEPHLRPDRPPPVRPPGGMAGLPGRLAPVPHLQPLGQVEGHRSPLRPGLPH